VPACNRAVALALLLLLQNLFTDPGASPFLMPEQLRVGAAGRYLGRGAWVPWVPRQGSVCCGYPGGEHAPWVPRRGDRAMRVTREEASMRCGYHGWGARVVGTQAGERACHRSCVALLLGARLRLSLSGDAPGQAGQSYDGNQKPETVRDALVFRREGCSGTGPSGRTALAAVLPPVDGVKGGKADPELCIWAVHPSAISQSCLGPCWVSLVGDTMFVICRF